MFVLTAAGDRCVGFAGAKTVAAVGMGLDRWHCGARAGARRWGCGIRWPTPRARAAGTGFDPARPGLRAVAVLGGGRAGATASSRDSLRHRRIPPQVADRRVPGRESHDGVRCRRSRWLRWWAATSAFAIPLAAAVGVPAYMNGYAAIPLISGLLEMGMSNGAALAFAAAGAVSCIPAAIAVWALVRRSVFVLYLAPRSRRRDALRRSSIR